MRVGAALSFTICSKVIATWLFILPPIEVLTPNGCASVGAYLYESEKKRWRAQILF
jgi:hypothetical protein